MKKRRWTGFLLALCMLLALAGCGQQNQKFTAEKLNVWIWDESQLKTLESLAAQWTEETRIDVEFTVKDRETYWSEVDRGMLPDVLWMDSSHVQTYIASGTLLQLDSYLEESREVSLDRYYPQLVSAYQSGGHTYALPKDSSVTALWYNKNIFDSMSMAYPDETWTWEDLYTNAKKLTNRHNGSFGLAIPPEDGADGWYNLVYSYGGSILKTDESGNLTSGWGDPETGTAMELLARLIRDCMPSQPTMAQVGVEELFAGGHVAMILRSSEEAMELIDRSGASQWACVRLPYCDRDGSGDCGEGERVSLLDGGGWVISSKTSDKAAAFDLLTVFCDEEGQKALSAANLAQPAYKGAGEEWGKSIESWDFSPYRTTLTEGTLIAVPVQAPGQSWEDYALSTTLYAAWNNPDCMAGMVSQQQTYTVSDLRENQAAASEEEPSDAAGAGQTDENSGESTPEEHP